MGKINNKKKLCPPSSYFYGPTLKALDLLGGSGSTGEIYRKVLEITGLQNEIIDEMHSFTMTEVEYRLMWARTDLKNYGAIVNSKQGVWSLTVKGAKMIKDGQIDSKEIKKSLSVKKKALNSNENESAEEDMVRDWHDRISEILHNIDPYAFEILAQRLLRECGFSDVEVTKKSGDGGIDGTGKLRINGIFSFHVAFQCKRYRGQISASQIRDFRGSLGTNIEKGVFITTGTFSRSAKAEASSEGKRLIDLMDGEELINKLAEYGIGLNEIKTYEVDEEYFRNLNSMDKI